MQQVERRSVVCYWSILTLSYPSAGSPVPAVFRPHYIFTTSFQYLVLTLDFNKKAYRSSIDLEINKVPLLLAATYSAC